jgi:hypothetical protein
MAIEVKNKCTNDKNYIPIEQEHQMNHSTNNQKVDNGTQSIVDEQVGA